MQITLSPAQATLFDHDPEAAGRALLDDLQAQARRLSARGGYISVYFDYESVEILHPDGRVLAVVEADPWAEEQKELARRIFAAADSEDVVSREAAAALVQSEYGDAHPEWRKVQYGTALAEQMGCWQAYASLCESRPDRLGEDEADEAVADE
ncbi:MAG: hypothetical protein WC326_00280 [Candidatus Delongbacteria bacterium]